MPRCTVFAPSYWFLVSWPYFVSKILLSHVSCLIGMPAVAGHPAGPCGLGAFADIPSSAAPLDAPNTGCPGGCACTVGCHAGGPCMPGGRNVGGLVVADGCCGAGIAHELPWGADIPGTGNDGSSAAPIGAPNTGRSLYMPDCPHAVPLGAAIPGIGNVGAGATVLASPTGQACASAWRTGVAMQNCCGWPVATCWPPYACAGPPGCGQVDPGMLA